MKSQQSRGSFQSIRRRSCVHSVTKCDWACSSIFLATWTHNVRCSASSQEEHSFSCYFLFHKLLFWVRTLASFESKAILYPLWGPEVACCFTWPNIKRVTNELTGLYVEVRNEIFHFLNGDLPCHTQNVHVLSWDMFVNIRICGTCWGCVGSLCLFYFDFGLIFLQSYSSECLMVFKNYQTPNDTVSSNATASNSEALFLARHSKIVCV